MEETATDLTGDGVKRGFPQSKWLSLGQKYLGWEDMLE